MAAIADWCARTVLPGAGPPHPLGRAGAGTRFLPAWLRAALLYELTGAVMGKQGALAVLARGKAAMAPMASMLLLRLRGRLNTPSSTCRRALAGAGASAAAGA